MKKQNPAYASPAMEEFEIAMEKGVAASTSTSSTMNEYTETDYSDQTDFWQ
jgi:hypothetical protein